MLTKMVRIMLESWILLKTITFLDAYIKILPNIFEFQDVIRRCIIIGFLFDKSQYISTNYFQLKKIKDQLLYNYKSVQLLWKFFSSDDTSQSFHKGTFLTWVARHYHHLFYQMKLALLSSLWTFYSKSRGYLYFWIFWLPYVNAVTSSYIT